MFCEVVHVFIQHVKAYSGFESSYWIFIEVNWS